MLLPKCSFKLFLSNIKHGLRCPPLYLTRIVVRDAFVWVKRVCLLTTLLICLLVLQIVCPNLMSYRYEKPTYLLWYWQGHSNILVTFPFHCVQIIFDLLMFFLSIAWPRWAHRTNYSYSGCYHRWWWIQGRVI